jgi:methylenetetrahydrofolate--tRNA-(uracil-5-)-methyltransferase
VLASSLEHRRRRALFYAGQITGVEGYVESIGTGLLAGINAARRAKGADPVVPPAATGLGALVEWLSTARVEDYQPMNMNFGLLPPLASRTPSRKERYRQMAERALAAMRRWSREVGEGREP